MFRKKNRFITVIICVIALLGMGSAWYLANHTNEPATPTLTIGTEAGFKPFEYIKGGQVVGFDIDIAKEIAKDQHKQLIVEEMSFDGLLSALQSKRVDMVAAGMTVTPERSKSVLFSDPYYEASQVLLVRKDDTRIHSKSDLKGRKVGVQLGTTGDNLVDGIQGAQKVQFPQVPAVLQELETGRIDAVVLDSAPATNYLSNYPTLKKLDQELSRENYAIAVNRGNPQLLESVNSTINRVKADGTYDELIKKHFTTSHAVNEKMSLKEIFFGDNRYKMLLVGLGVTLLLAALAVTIGIILGVITAVARISRFYPFQRFENSSWKWLRKLAKINPLAELANLYTTVIRGTPVLVQLLILYYVVFGSFQTMPKLIIAALAFGINSGAYVAEILRSGFSSLPKGQWESAESLGFSYIQTIRYIIMPQVLRRSVPSLMNELITQVKETSIVGWIGLNDLMRGADNIRFQTATAFESLIVAAIIYLVITTILTRISARIERKFHVSD